MASDDNNPDQIDCVSLPPTNPSSTVPWKERVLIPTLLAGVAGGAVGSVSKHRKVHGLSKISTAYASNFAIVTGCYCGAREFVKVSRNGKPDDLLNSVIGGFGSGAILGRLQGGQKGAVRYSVIFAVVGTAVDYTTVAIMPSTAAMLSKFVAEKKESWLRLPEWSPIRILDEEAVAEKRAREQQIFREVHNLTKKNESP